MGDGAGAFGVEFFFVPVSVLACLVFVGYPVRRILGAWVSTSGLGCSGSRGLRSSRYSRSGSSHSGTGQWAMLQASAGSLADERFRADGMPREAGPASRRSSACSC